MQYALHDSVSIHEGETKFYRVMVLRASSGQSVLITHWGKRNFDIQNPKDHGQHKSVALAASVSGHLEAESIIKSKMKRGYRIWDEAVVEDVTDLSKTLNELLDPPEAAEAFKHLTGRPHLPVEEPPKRKVETTPIPEEIQRPAEWGSW